jgi:hypothetical protein
MKTTIYKQAILQNLSSYPYWYRTKNPYVSTAVALKIRPVFNLISSHTPELHWLKFILLCVWFFKLQERAEGSSFDGEVISWLNKNTGLSRMKVVHNKPLNTLNQYPNFLIQIRTLNHVNQPVAYRRVSKPV